MIKKILFACAFGAGLMVTSAAAQTDPQPTPRNPDRQRRNERRDRQSQDPGDRKFNKLDVDRDGYLSKNEWRGRDKGFERADNDNDGRISRFEYTVFEQGRIGKKNK